MVSGKGNYVMQEWNKERSINTVIQRSFFTDNECEEVIKYSYKIRKYFEDLDVKSGGHIYSKEQINTANYNRYNFFRDNPKYINRLYSTIQETLPWLEFPIAIQAWTNIYSPGEGIGWHNHDGLGGHSYTANIFIGGVTEPGVIYTEPGKDETCILNRVGEMLLCGCSLGHMVPPNQSDSPRYSVGMTIHDYEAITKEIMSTLSITSPFSKGIIILKEEAMK